MAGYESFASADADGTDERWIYGDPSSKVNFKNRRPSRVSEHRLYVEANWEKTIVLQSEAPVEVSEHSPVGVVDTA